MTTSEPRAGRRAPRHDCGRGGGAVPADDLAVAVFSGRRVLLFQRHRMGGGGRRHHRCCIAAGLARGDAVGWRRAFAMPCFWRMRIAPRAAQDDTALREVAELAAAFVPSRERHLETTAQGRAFIDIARAAWSCDGLDAWSRHATARSPIPSPSAWSRGHGVPLAPTLHAFLHAHGRELDFRGRAADSARPDRQPARAGALEPVVAAIAKRALDATLDDLGSATFRADLASMRHETQYTRLFRS